MISNKHTLYIYNCFFDSVRDKFNRGKASILKEKWERGDEIRRRVTKCGIIKRKGMKRRD